MLSPARCLLLACVLTALASTAQAFDAKQQSKTIAPFLDDGTIVVARVDLTKVDLGEFFKAIPTYMPVPKNELAQGEKMLTGFVAALRAQKVSDAYMLLSLEDIPHGSPTVIVPVGDGGNYETVASLLFSGQPDGPTERIAGQRRSAFEICTRVGNVVFCGSKRTLERVKSKKPSKRKHLAAALETAAGGAIQVAFVPSTDHHRVISETLTRLPKELGGIDGPTLSKAVQWAALKVQLPPKLGTDLVIQAKDAESAKKLNDTIKTLGEAVGKQKHSIGGQLRTIDLAKVPLMLKPTLKGDRLSFSFRADSPAGKRLVAMMSIAGKQAKKAAARASSKNTLKQFGLAMHNFHDVYKSFPPVASFKKEKKLLSWRVYVLPFLEQNELFKQFHLDEAWDSPHNKKLIAKMPRLFADPSGKLKKAGMTRYMVPVGKNFIFDGKPEGLRIREITDGTSNTIMLVEAAPENAVVWTKPDDLPVDTKNPFKGLIGKDGKGFLATFADGSVRFISKSMKPKILKALFTRNGGEVVTE